MSKTLTDLTNYKKIFPALIKDVKIDPSNKNHAKFVIEAQGTREADIRSTILPDGTFTVDIISGELKGSRIITTLKERYGFDGTPNGGTTVTTKLILEYGYLVKVALFFVGDSEIQNAVGNGFYDLGKYIKTQYPQQKQQLVNVDYKNNVPPKLEAAKKLDPKKEAQKIQLIQSAPKKEKVDTLQSISEKREAAKKLVAERNHNKNSQK